MVNNAVDAILDTPPKAISGLRPEVWTTTFCAITDSGAGVKDPSKVFDPFYTTKPVGKGTGLGLSICYGIVTEHGGTIRVKNLPPRGASSPSKSVPEITATKPEEASKLPTKSDQAKILLSIRNVGSRGSTGVLKNLNHQVFPREILKKPGPAPHARIRSDLCDVEVAGRKE